MLKKIIYLIIVLCSFTEISYSDSKQINGRLCRRIEGYGGVNFSNVSDGEQNDIGTNNIPKQFRSLFSFDLSEIPPGAVISSVVMNSKSPHYCGDEYAPNYYYRITDASYIESLADQYAGIASASTVITEKYPDSGQSDITNKVVSARNNGQSMIYFGACSSDEVSWTSNASIEIYIVVNYYIFVHYVAQNNYSGGLIYVKTRSSSGGNENSPYPFTALENSAVTLGAVEDNQTDENGYSRIFNDTEAPSNKSNWLKWLNGFSSSSGSSSTINFNANYSDNNAVYEAQMKKICNVTFSANISGYLTVGSTTQSIPYSTTAVEGNSTTSVNAVNQSLDGSIRGEFVKWSDNVTTATRSVTPTGTTEVTAYYKIYPNNSYRNMQFNSTIGEPITITWNEHPNSNVGSYNIYRKSYGETTPTLIASVNRGTTTYVDNEFVISANTGPNSRIAYDVRAVYSGSLPDGTTYTTEADASAQTQFGAPGVPEPPELSKQAEDNARAKTAESLAIAPTEYSLGSYPNPFNPTTVIRYTMPEAGQVSLKVYNILSQEVANLVESNQSAGVHQVNFNASHLPTGIYIARLQAGAKVMTAKLQLVK